jgi:flagellar biosynthesis protein FlhF
MATPPNTQQLQIKSYFARSVQDAIEHARGEMGADALLLNSRPAPPEARYLGEYEVVFGKYPERPAPVAAPAPEAAAPFADVEDLRQRMDEIRNLLMRPAAGPETRHARYPDLLQALLSADIEIDVAADIEDAVAQRLNQRTAVTDISIKKRRVPDWDPETVRAETIAEIESRTEIAPPPGRITALVGPPGAGKTTTLIKMAVNQTISTGRSVPLISTDSHRIGAAEQFRTYATILGVPFQTVESPAALARAIESSSEASHIFIDTPGLSPALIGELGMDLAGFLASRQDIDTHLVLTASMKQINLEKAAERYAVYNPTRLAFTRLDETESVGPLFGLALRLGKPLSFLCHGQLIPEDIEPATKSRISEALVRHLPRSLKPVA